MSIEAEIIEVEMRLSGIYILKWSLLRLKMAMSEKRKDLPLIEGKKREDILMLAEHRQSRGAEARETSTETVSIFNQQNPCNIAYLFEDRFLNAQSID